ncbi:hypothetical protein [Streptomyces sp. SAS_272]|uniref:hypothetical protein n=1 Tax=Streptomyces sp. SAS_272 TaxID=3412747 RepID=UPI00403D2D87
MTTRLEVLGEDGEWQEVPGVVSVELHAELEDAAERQVLSLAEVQEQYARFVAAFARQVGARYARCAAQIVDQLHAATAAGQAYAAALRPTPDRPAWQSPYGPARRRR